MYFNFAVASIMNYNFHVKHWEEVADFFGTDPERGLSPTQVAIIYEKVGPNGKAVSCLVITSLCIRC